MPKAPAKKSGTLPALDYLAAPDKHPPAAVCAVFGDDPYLRSEVLAALRRQVLAGEDAEFALNTFTGKEAQLREVLDALATVSLFGNGRRLVVVEEADPFVTHYREDLEEYVAKVAGTKVAGTKVAGTLRVPSANGPRSVPATKGGILVLDVKTWPGNTRIAKAVAAHGLAVECKAPTERQLKTWLTQHAKAEHQVRLDPAAAEALLDLVPPELGILVQEVAKLALLTDEKKLIDVNLVRENVGGWRTRATWDMIDAAADGRAAEAIAQLDRLIASGEKPHGLLPQMAGSLRRFTTAVQLVDLAQSHRQRLPLRNALSQAGVLPFKLDDAERQLRQIGRNRMKQLTRWLLATDLAIKGYNSSDERARMELERLILRLSATAQNAN